MKHRFTCTLGMLALAASAAAQSAPLPTFDVASIKPSNAPQGGPRDGIHGPNGPFAGARRERITASPGSLIMANVRFATMVRWAYNVEDYQVTGPGWIRDDRYDLSAKAGTAAPEAELRLMLQALLAERFRMTMHRQTRETAAYVIVVAKGGPKMTESTSEGPPAMRQNGMMSVTAERADVGEMTGMLSQALQAPVINETGLKGRYDFKVDLAPYITPELISGKGPPDVAGIAMAALQEQLGLKLESKKIPLDLIVVDRAERSPVEN